MSERSGTERKQRLDKSAETPWNELRAALIQAQADAEHEQPEGCWQS